MSLNCYFQNIYNRKTEEYETFVANSQFFLGDKVFIRCGSCYNCRKFKAIEWVNKAKLELKYWRFAYFLTLTYSPENVPLELVPRHYQLFLKRLRRNIDYYYKEKVKYIVAGEYGDRYKRPHYHMILFSNIDFLPTFYKVTKKQYSSRFFEELWGLGFITIAPATIETIAYTTFYSTKKLSKQQKFSFLKKYSVDGFIPRSEFIYASNDLGVSEVKDNLDFYKKHWRFLPASLLRASIFGEEFVEAVKMEKQELMFKLHTTIDWKKQRQEYLDIERKEREILYQKRLLKFK